MGSDLQFQAVYNVLSFSLASMMATTCYLWFRAYAVQDKYKSAVFISGLVTFIAAYHYIRIFNSWVDAYQYSAGEMHGNALDMVAPTLTGIPFNDAYRYMDWLLTVISWCTYPIVYLFPMLGVNAAQAVVSIQMG